MIRIGVIDDTADISINWVRSKFGNQTIGMRLAVETFPPQSTDLTACHYWLWAGIKRRVHERRLGQENCAQMTSFCEVICKFTFPPPKCSDRSPESPKNNGAFSDMWKLGFRPRPFRLYFQPVAKNINPLRIGVETNPRALK